MWPTHARLAVCSALACGLSSAALADTIPAGYDLLATLPGTYFDFGGAIGVVPLRGLPIDPVNLGPTDTIIQRLEAINFPTTGTTPYAGNPSDPGTPGTDVTIQVEMVALSLQSVQPIDIGGSFFDVFVTLNNTQASVGSMHIDHRWSDSGQFQGTFDSFFDVFFDIRLDPILPGSDILLPNNHINLESNDTLWQQTPDGLRFTVREEHPGGQGVHMAETVPLPPAAWAGVTSLLGLGGVMAVRRRVNR